MAKQISSKSLSEIQLCRIFIGSSKKFFDHTTPLNLMAAPCVKIAYQKSCDLKSQNLRSSLFKCLKFVHVVNKQMHDLKFHEQFAYH